MNGEGAGTIHRSSPRAIFSILVFFAMIFCVPPMAGAIELPNAVPGASDPLCTSEILADGVLSLQRAVNLALCNNAELRTAVATVESRLAERGEALAAYWPTINLSGTELQEKTQNINSREPSMNSTAFTEYGSLTWRLFDFGGRRADARAATKFLQSAYSLRDATVQKVLGEVLESYFDAITAQSLLDSKKETEAVAEETLASADRRSRRGDGQQIDVLQATTALAKTRLDSSRARAALAKAVAVLTYTVGLSPGSQYTLAAEPESDADMDNKSLSAWLEEARHNHPAITSAREELEASEARVSSVRSSGRPTIDFQANLYENGFPQQGISASRQRNTTLGVAVNIPLFDGFLTRYKIRAAEADVHTKQIALMDTERATLSEIVKSYSDAASAVDNLAASRQLVEAALAAQISSRRRYDAGVVDVSELLITQSALADARQERVRSLAEWRSARLRLLATSGVMSTTPDL
jgi:outer membrane protein